MYSMEYSIRSPWQWKLKMARLTPSVLDAAAALSQP
ncbi:GSCOCG00002388001-RA-CDS [Cotesia congregata]|nr:GSCOCG00002388001-RA-CDS [Cotesia congregata]